MVRRQEVIDHVEAVLAGRIIGAADIDEANEPALRIVPQEGRRPDDVLAADDDRQLVEGNGPVLDRLAEGRGDMIAQGLEISTHAMTFAQRSMVPVRRIFFCRSSTPYRSASAVGGQPGT